MILMRTFLYDDRIAGLTGLKMHRLKPILQIKMHRLKPMLQIKMHRLCVPD
jgi:hypothetical protein